MAENLNTLKVADLVRKLKELNIAYNQITGTGKGGKVIKPDMINAIKNNKVMSSPKKSVTSPKQIKSSSPKQIKSLSPKQILRCDDNGKNKCIDQICRTTDGNCIKKTKAGKPFGEQRIMGAIKKTGNEYKFDETYNILGTKEEVNEHIVLWSKNPIPSPKVKTIKTPQIKVKSPQIKVKSPKVLTDRITIGNDFKNCLISQKLL